MTRDILIAPFSNSEIRNWPVAGYVGLIRLLLSRWDGTIRLIGTVGQKLAACEIARPFPPDRVVNDCGRLSWAETIARVPAAACVIANNSGIAHLAGQLGAPTVCVFGGSHQRHEWRPKGANLVIVSRAIGCSPCQLDHGWTSPYDKACLRLIEPETVARAVAMVMAKADEEARAA